MERKVYADYSATTYVKDEVIKEMIPYFNDKFGNPSSIHFEGERAKKEYIRCKNIIKDIFNCSKEEIYFTSSGTESLNLGIKGIARANKDKGNHIITSKIEHKAVLNSLKQLESEGFKVTYLDVDKYGIVNLNELINSINKDTILITIMYANNEIGTIENIKEIGNIAKFNNIPLHVDATQAIGTINIDVKKLNISSLTISGHKIYAPKGIGMLYVNKNVKFSSILQGGPQENFKRAGSENVPYIIGFTKALELNEKNKLNYYRKLYNLREYLIYRLLNEIKGCKLNGHRRYRLVNNINVSIPNINNDELIVYLSLKGICISSASACSSGSKKCSHVLKAIGLTECECLSSIRISLGEKNTREDMDYIIDSIKEYLNKVSFSCKV